MIAASTDAVCFQLGYRNIGQLFNNFNAHRLNYGALK